MSTTSAQINASVENIAGFFRPAIQATCRSSHPDLQFDFSSVPSEQLDCSGLAQGLWDDSYLETQQEQLSQPSLSSFSFDQFGVSDSQDTSSVPTPLDQFLASATTSVPHSEAGEVSFTGLISSAEIFPQDLAESQSFSEFPGQFDSFCSPSEDLLSLAREDSHEGQLVQTEEHQDLMSGTILQQPTFNPRAERLSPSRPSPSCLSFSTFQLGNRLSANRDHASSLTSSRTADHYQTSQTSASEAQPTSPCYSSSNSASNRETVLEPSRRGKRSFDESTLPSTKSAENSEEDKIVEKRRRNTLAARRFRQKQQDRVTNLEAELAIVTKERDELKMLVARYQGETEALRKLVADGKKT
ncbi:transcriptional regulator family: bZIP [Paecilomyces variotii]|nr:transcriptional regulator family: bZIP [Paecilomyces variotii]